MRFNKLYILTIILLFFTQNVFSQLLTNDDDDYVLSEKDITTKDKIDVSTKIGFGAGISNNGSFLSTTIRPTISYHLSQKFSIYTGVGYSNYQLENFNMLSEFGYQAFSGNLSQMQAFVGGKYQVNDRLAVGGEVFYNFIQFSPANSNFNQLSVLDKVGYAAYFEYKITDNLYIEGQIRVNDMNRGSNLYNPFRNHGFGSGDFMRQSSGINTMPFSR